MDLGTVNADRKSKCPVHRNGYSGRDDREGRWA